MGDHGRSHERHSADIEIVDVGEVRGCDVCGGADKLAAGVVDEDVDVRTESFDRSFDYERWSSGIAEIGLDGTDLAVG